MKGRGSGQGSGHPVVVAVLLALACLLVSARPTLARKDRDFKPHSQTSLPLNAGPGVTMDELNNVRQRLDVLPDHLFAMTHNNLMLRFQLGGVVCGRIPDTAFCLQSLPTTRWIGSIVTHYPLGVGNLTVTDVSASGFRLTSTYTLDVSRPNETISTGAISMFSQFLPPTQKDIMTRGEIEFTCARNITVPTFPHLSLGIDRIMEDGMVVHRYRLVAAHHCVCSTPDPSSPSSSSANGDGASTSSSSATTPLPLASSTTAGSPSSSSSTSEHLLAHPSCEYFNTTYSYASAMDEWERKSPDHSYQAHKCFTRVSGRLSIWAGIGTLLIALIWGMDVWLGVPLIACESCTGADRHVDETSTCRGRCLTSSAPRHRLHPIGTARYIWTFGFLDVLTPPVNMLERRDSAWATAAGFGMMSLTIPFVFNGALELTQILELLLFFTPILLCRHARVPSIGLCLGCFFSIIALGEIGTLMGCLGRTSSFVNLMATLPSLLCAMLVVSWYVLETKRRFVALWLWFNDRGPRPVSWRERALLALDRSGYVASLLADKIKVSLGESLTWSAFRATILGQDNYSVPTRLLTAVILAISCLVSLLPLTMSYASLAGAAVEWIMSMGHCCSGVQCDPTPGSSLWIRDAFDLGYGIQVGRGHSCSRDQIVVRRAVSYGMTVSTSVTAVAVTFSLLHVLVVYRKRMFLLFRGRPDFITKHVPMDKSIGSTLKFGGTQVASAIGGWVLGTCVLTLLIGFIAISTVLPFMNIYGDWFWPWWFQFVIYNHETGALGFPVILLINYWLLLFCVRFVFEISKKDHGLQRRGFFHLMDLIQFIFYILNALLGLIKRAVTSMVLQAVFVSRMDKSLMPRKYELTDKSYVAYLGFMQLDYYYSHPVLLTAVYFFLAGTPRDRRTARRLGIRLWRSRNRGDRVSLSRVTSSPRSPDSGGGGIELTSSMESPGLQLGGSASYQDSINGNGACVPEYTWRVRNRFWLAITLHNNPQLKEQRSHYLRAKAEEQRLKELREAAKVMRSRRMSLHEMAHRVTRASAHVAHTLAGLRYHAMDNQPASTAESGRDSPKALLADSADGTNGTNGTKAVASGNGYHGGGIGFGRSGKNKYLRHYRQDSTDDHDDDDDDDEGENAYDYGDGGGGGGGDGAKSSSDDVHVQHRQYDVADSDGEALDYTCPPNTLLDLSQVHLQEVQRKQQRAMEDEDGLYEELAAFSANLAVDSRSGSRGGADSGDSDDDAGGDVARARRGVGSFSPTAGVTTATSAPLSAATSWNPTRRAGGVGDIDGGGGGGGGDERGRAQSARLRSRVVRDDGRNGGGNGAGERQRSITFADRLSQSTSSQL